MKKYSLKINYFFNLLYQLINVITPFITAPYISRVLGPDGIGVFSYYSSINSYFCLAANLGIGSYGQIEIARCNDDEKKRSELFLEFIYMKLVLGIIVLVPYIFLILFVKDRLIFSILIISLIASIIDISFVYAGLENFKKVSIRNTVIKFISIICLFILIKEKDDLYIYVLYSVILSLLSSVALWFGIHKVINFTYIKTINFIFCKHIKGCVLFFLPTVAVSLYTVFSKTLLGLISNSNYENGYYEQSYRLITIILSVLVSLFTVLCSRISSLMADNDKNAVQANIKLGINYTTFLAFPFTLGILAVSQNFIIWFLGEDFAPSVSILNILSVMIITEGLAECLSCCYYNPSGKRWLSCKCLFVGVIFNIVLNIILIPKFKGVGASIATTGASFVICVLYIIFSYKYIHIKGCLKNSLKHLGASIFMYVVLQVLSKYVFYGTNFLLLVQQVISGMLLYCVCLLFIREDLFMNFLGKLKSGLFEK